MSFTGWKVKEGRPYQYFPDAVAPLRLTTLTCLAGQSVVTATVKVDDGADREAEELVVACLQGPSTLKIDLQFDSEVLFKVKGAEVHFAGYHFWTGRDDLDELTMSGEEDTDEDAEELEASDESDYETQSESSDERGSQEDEPMTPAAKGSTGKDGPKPSSSEKKRLEWKTPIAEFSPAPGSGRGKEDAKGAGGQGAEEKGKRDTKADKALKTKEQQALAKQGG